MNERYMQKEANTYRKSDSEQEKEWKIITNRKTKAASLGTINIIQMTGMCTHVHTSQRMKFEENNKWNDQKSTHDGFASQNNGSIFFG